MDKEKIIANLAYINMKKDVLFINGSLALSVLFSSCAPKGPETTQVNASGENENNNNSSEQSSSTENLTQEQIAQRTLDNFVANHPEYKDREAGVVNFIINGVDASTVVFETTEAEKAEVSERKYVIEGDEVKPFTGAIVWTKETDFDGNERWVRLAGVQFQNEGDTTDTIYTVWYSSPHEDYTKVSTNVDFKRKVFAFNSNDDEYAYWPQVNPPTKIVWSNDMTQTDPSKFEFWNGNDPFMLPVKQVVEGGSKSLFAPAAVESPEPALPAEMEEAQEFFGEGFEVTPEGRVIDKNLGKEISGFKIVPFDENRMINRGSRTQEPPTWALERVYEFEGQKDFTVYLTEYDLKREDAKIIGYGWIYENGKFTRKQVEFSTQVPNKKVYIEGYSPEEIQYMITINSSNNPIYSHDGYKAYQALTSIVPVNVVDKALFITYKGMWEPMDYNITGWGHNIIPVNNNGEWELVNTTEYGLFNEFKDRSKALIIWYDKNDEKVVYVVDGKYLDLPYMFNQYWKDVDPRNPFGS